MNNAINHLFRDIYPSHETIQKLKLGSVFIGGAATAYFAHNNYDFLINTADSLFMRSVDGFSFLQHQILIPIWENFATYFGGTLITIYGAFKTYEFGLILSQTKASNNPWLTFKFLMSCWFFVDEKIKEAIFKLSPRVLDQIVTSTDSWEKLKVLKDHVPNVTSTLKDMIYIADYPYDLFINVTRESRPIFNGTETKTTYSFRYPSLLSSTENTPPMLWDVLFYLGKFPELHTGDNKIDATILSEILSSQNACNKLNTLCENKHLWQGPYKLDSNILTILLNNKWSNIISTWLPLFQKQGNDFLKDLHQILNLECACTEHLRTIIHQRLNNLLTNLHPHDNLNMNKMINDSDIDHWNVLSGLSDKLLADSVALLMLVMGKINLGPSKVTSVLGFITKTLESSEAKTEAGSLAILKRVFTIINYIEGLLSEWEKNLNPKEKNQLFQRLMLIFNTMIDGGSACTDRAIIALELTENKIKLFQGQYIANVIVSMFKANLINAKLINQNRAENLETYLYYILQFNKILGLGLVTSSMLHAGCAQKQPLGTALYKLLDAFTEKNLIGYAAKLEEFKLLFANELENKLEELVLLMDEVYCIDELDSQGKEQIITKIQSFGIILEEKEIAQIYNKPNKAICDSLMIHLDNRRQRIEDNFYQEKAKILFLKAGFLNQDLK